jgi:hypothetical protein
MNFQMKGKIGVTEFYNGNHYTVIQTPAPDSYSQPSSFRVRSATPLGANAQEIELDCSISGFVRPKTFTNKSGQQQTIQEPNVFIDAAIASPSKPNKGVA